MTIHGRQKRKAVPFFEDVAGPQWRTAVYTLIFLLQEDTLPLLTCKHMPGWTKRRDSDGKVTETQASDAESEAPLQQTKMIKVNSIEEAMELMKKMGIKDDDPQMKQLKDLQNKQGKGK